MKILILYNELKTTCGVSKSLLYFLRSIDKKDNIEFYILIGGGDAISKYRELVNNIYVYPRILHSKRSLINFLMSIRFVWKVIRQNKIDIVHSHYHYVANIAEIVSLFCKVKTVQTVHGQIPARGILHHFPANNLIVVNEYLKYSVLKESGRKKNLAVINTGVFYNRNHLFKNNLMIKIIVGCRLVPGKGIETFINAVEKLPEIIRNRCEIMIAGTGQQEKELVALNDLKKTNIAFLGEIQDFQDLLSTTDIFVLPSSLDEGFPVSLIEAGLQKNLAILSDLQAYRELLLDKTDVILFKKNNVNDLRDKLIFSIENFEELEYMRTNLNEKMEKNFNIISSKIKLLQLYRELLK